MLAFSLDGPSAHGGHIIPVFGHTFNEDTWAPRGEGAYFRVGERIRYIPSDSWISSFLIHDDNFGSNLCLPKRFVRRRHADYVLAVRPRGFDYAGFLAEVLAGQFFYTMLPKLVGSGNVWLERLLECVGRQELILRTVPMTRPGYVQHLETRKDWENRTEAEETVQDVARLLRDHMWMVEVSIPELFSTNLRKLGELLVNAEKPKDRPLGFDQLLLARFAGQYVLFAGLDASRNPQFTVAKSALTTHTELLVRN